MGKKSMWSFLKDKIAAMGFKLFIWGNDTTEEEYWETVYQQEKQWKLDNHKEL